MGPQHEMNKLYPSLRLLIDHSAKNTQQSFVCGVGLAFLLGVVKA